MHEPYPERRNYEHTDRFKQTFDERHPLYDVPILRRRKTQIRKRLLKIEFNDAPYLTDLAGLLLN